MQYDQCLTRGADNSAVIITHCDQNQHTEWKYFKVRHQKITKLLKFGISQSPFLFHFYFRICIVSLMWQQVIYAFAFPPIFFNSFKSHRIKRVCWQWFAQLICSQENVWTDQTCSTKSLYPTVTTAKPPRNGRWITSWLYKEYLPNIQHIHTTSLQSCAADDVVVEPVDFIGTESDSLTAASDACPYAPR